MSVWYNKSEKQKLSNFEALSKMTKKIKVSFLHWAPQLTKEITQKY